MPGFSHSPIPCEAVMPATLESTPQLRATYALAEARKRRHHPDCRCRMWQKTACNAADALWTQKMDVELERIAAGEF